MDIQLMSCGSVTVETNSGAVGATFLSLFILVILLLHWQRCHRTEVKTYGQCRQLSLTSLTLHCLYNTALSEPFVICG